MNRKFKQKLGVQKNKLLRYQKILDYYHKIKSEYKYINMMDLYRDFIYPKFHISRTTFYTILATPVSKELKQIKEAENKQLNIFEF